MEVMTYLLREGEDSDPYYATITQFTDEVVDEAAILVRPLILDFQRYRLQSAPEVACSEEENLVDLLTLGTLWQVYCDDALHLGALPQNILSGLARLRQSGGCVKPGADFLRGILATLFLKVEDNEEVITPNRKYLQELLQWLDATGEFQQEVQRLRSWYDYFTTVSDAEVADGLASVITLAAWFELRSEQVLGCYTEQVPHFLSDVHPQYKWREDVVFCGRRRVEYHLNMVGAELLNRAFREAFHQVKHIEVLLPGCMRALPAEECPAISTPLGYRCVGCTTTCRVHQLTQKGEEYGCGVAIITHESSFNRKGVGTTDGKLGIIGIACVLNLIAGGWKAKALGLPAQCVLLDYCGCKNHWHVEGFPTDLNIRVLRGILEHHELAHHLECQEVAETIIPNAVSGGEI